MRHAMDSGHGLRLGRGFGHGFGHEPVGQRATDATDATGTAVVATDPAPTRALIWRLQSGGWTDIEAGNLAAIALGLRPARTGWTGAELDHLHFIKSLVNTGRIEH